MERLLEASDGDFLLGIPWNGELEIEPRAIGNLIETMETTGAGIVYSDFRIARGNECSEITSIDYQLGSIRESFDFGPLLAFSGEAVKRTLEKHGKIDASLRWSALYDLRLKLSIDFPVARIPEPIYTIRMPIARPVAGEESNFVRDFDLVDLSNRDYQVELEAIVTSHLKRIGAYLEPVFRPLPPPEGPFPVAASVIIPVRNREKTIAQAVQSAINQRSSFAYNVIVINDYSSDKTGEIVRQLAAQRPNIVQLLPERRDLGIGGLWNEAIYSKECGMFAVQLDSDDVFSHEQALEKIIRKFWDAPLAESALAIDPPPHYAMVTGSFGHVNFNLEPIPPGVFLHHEFSEANGRNNALRMNGLGAPRAFYVPVLRRFGLPNVSYGEDYAICLRIGREFAVGRIFEPLYLARQWEGNTSRSMPLGSVKSVNLKDLLPPGLGERPDILARLQPLLRTLMMTSKNRYDSYKDWLRSVEIEARQQLNS